jgi:hypothetical protein
MPSRFQDMLKSQRQNTETSRAGLKWEQDEDDSLLKMLQEGVSLADIAKSLQRTEGSIKTRLTVYAINKMEKENISLQQVSELIGLTEKDILDYQERKAVREERRHKKSNTPKRPTNVTNGDIYDLLMVINKNLESLLFSR